MRPADMGALPGRQTQGCRPAAHGPAPSFLMSQPGGCGALAGVAAAIWWSAAGAALAGAAGSVAVSARGACAAWAAGGLPSRRRQLETPAAACRAGAATGVIAPVWDLRGRPADGRGVAGTGAAVRYAAAADCALAAAAGDLSTVLGVSAGADLPLSVPPPLPAAIPAARRLDRRQRCRLRLVTHRFRQLAGGGPDPDCWRLLRPDLPRRPLAAAGGGRAHAVWSTGVLGRHRRVFLPRAGVSRRRGSRCCSHARRGSGQHRRGPYSGPAPLGRSGSDQP